MPTNDTPTTFEEALDQAAAQILAVRVASAEAIGHHLPPQPALVGQAVADLKASFGHAEDDWIKGARLGFFSELGSESLIWLMDHWHRASSEEAMGEVTSLVARKQHDYGHGNILAFGAEGLIVRLSDKWARVENLTKRQGANAVAGEAMEDTYMDMVGYSLIGLMLASDTFTLPLEADKAQGNPLPENRHDPVYGASSDPRTAVGQSWPQGQPTVPCGWHEPHPCFAVNHHPPAWIN